MSSRSLLVARRLKQLMELGGIVLCSTKRGSIPFKFIDTDKKSPPPWNTYRSLCRVILIEPTGYIVRNDAEDEKAVVRLRIVKAFLERQIILNTWQIFSIEAAVS